MPPFPTEAGIGLGESVIEPRGSAVTEVGADGLMNRAEHLKQHVGHTGKGERSGERMAALHGGDEHSHSDREGGREDPSEKEDRPPSGGEKRIRLRQDSEE